MPEDATDLLIAGLRFRVASADATSRSHLAARMPEFLVPRRDGPGDPDVTIALAYAADVPNPSLFGQEAIIERVSPTRIAARRCDFDGWWDRATGEARCTYASDIGSLYSFLRIVSSFAILDRGGVLLHASSVVSRGRAFVFAGPSGAGKTTIARLGAPRPVLSDEVTAIRPGRRGVEDEDESLLYCHPTPFWGDMVRVVAGPSAPLAVLGFPVHVTDAARAPSLRTAAPADTFARLLECSIAFDLTRGEKDALLDVVKKIASRPICLHVEYALANPPWDLLDAVVPST